MNRLVRAQVIARSSARSWCLGRRAASASSLAHPRRRRAPRIISWAGRALGTRHATHRHVETVILEKQRNEISATVTRAHTTTAKPLNDALDKGTLTRVD